MFPRIGVPQNGWFILENPIKMDDLEGFPIFLETLKSCLMDETKNHQQLLPGFIGFIYSPTYLPIHEWLISMVYFIGKCIRIIHNSPMGSVHGIYKKKSQQHILVPRHPGPPAEVRYDWTPRIYRSNKQTLFTKPFRYGWMSSLGRPWKNNPFFLTGSP